MASPGFLSKRERKRSQSGLSTDRYEYLGLEQAEADLGDPLIGVSSIGAKPKPVSGDVYVLAAFSSKSNTGFSSNRYWVSSVDLTSGLSLTPGSFTVFNNDVQVGLANSFNKFNFVGAGVTVDAVGSGVTEQTGIATIRIAVTDAVAKGSFSAIQYHGAGGLIQGASNFSYDPNTNRVGIGTTLPRQDLDIFGNVIVSGVSTFGGITTITGETLFTKQLSVSGISTFSGIATFQSGLFGKDANFTGIVTGNIFNGQINSDIGTVTTLSGTNVTYTTGNFTTGNIVTGVITTLNSTNANLTNINSSGISTLGIISSTNLTSQQLNISGLSTFSGITTISGETLFVKQLNVAGVSTFNDVFVSSGSSITATNIGDRTGSTGVAGATLVRDATGIVWSTDAITVSAGGTVGNVQFHSASGLVGGNDGFNYDFTNQRVGIGTTNPITKLHISSDGLGGISTSLYVGSDYAVISNSGGATGAGFNIIVASNAPSSRGVFKGTRSRGTLSSPTVPINGDWTSSLLGSIYDGSSNLATAAINMEVDGDVGVGTAPQRIVFYTGIGTLPNGSVNRIERGRFTSDGNCGIGVTIPASKLHVGGDFTLGETSNINPIYTVGVGTTVVTGTATTTINSLGVTSFRSVKYQVQIAQGSDFQATDILAIHNGTTANLIEYGSIATGEYLGSFDTEIVGNDLRLNLTLNVGTAATVSVAYHGMRIV